MKTSTEIASLSRRVGEERAIELFAKSGFDCWDFSMFEMAKYDWQNNSVIDNDHPLHGKDYIKFAKKLKQVGLDNGITCNQSHAPFPSYCKGIWDYVKRAIECTAEAGGKICVVHPDNFKRAKENAQMYMEILPFAKEHGVKIATENMWNSTWDEVNNKVINLPSACSDHIDFLNTIKEVNDEFFVACVDIGHAEMSGLNTSADKMIRTLGKHVGALHIHDNDKDKDLHELPLTDKIDFDIVVKALKDIKYCGEFTLEADTYLNKIVDDELNSAVKNMANTARFLANKFENIK